MEEPRDVSSRVRDALRESHRDGIAAEGGANDRNRLSRGLRRSNARYPSGDDDINL